MPARNSRRFARTNAGGDTLSCLPIGICSTVGAKAIRESHDDSSLADATDCKVRVSASATMGLTDFGIIRNTRMCSMVSTIRRSGSAGPGCGGRSKYQSCRHAMCLLRPLRVKRDEHTGQGTLGGGSCPALVVAEGWALLMSWSITCGAEILCASLRAAA